MKETYQTSVKETELANMGHAIEIDSTNIQAIGDANSAHFGESKQQPSHSKPI